MSSAWFEAGWCRKLKEFHVMEESDTARGISWHPDFAATVKRQRARAIRGLRGRVGMQSASLVEAVKTAEENRSRRRKRFINAGRYTMVAIYAVAMLGETQSYRAAIAVLLVAWFLESTRD
ncbi:MAG: hypothetical protein B9S38_02390 [Verrucomicrobiia bacterium Tous-C4TDCM]|nr:MAG: hypothetical protein B9S38_02390 [Verrucomicrobiae bacterium Tous-C4TDCM]